MTHGLAEKRQEDYGLSRIFVSNEVKDATECCSGCAGVSRRTSRDNAPSVHAPSNPRRHVRKALPERLANVGQNRFERFARMDVELAVELRAVTFDGAHRNTRAFRNLRVGEVLEDEGEYPHFVLGKGLRPFLNPLLAGTEPPQPVTVKRPIESILFL